MSLRLRDGMAAVSGERPGGSNPGDVGKVWSAQIYARTHAGRGLAARDRQLRQRCPRELADQGRLALQSWQQRNPSSGRVVVEA
jgi:hypothetical protein